VSPARRSLHRRQARSRAAVRRLARYTARSAASDRLWKVEALSAAASRQRSSATAIGLASETWRGSARDPRVLVAEAFLQDFEPARAAADPSVSLVERVRDALRFDHRGPFDEFAEHHEWPERIVGGAELLLDHLRVVNDFGTVHRIHRSSPFGEFRIVERRLE